VQKRHIDRVRSYAMSRRRQQRRADKARRHLPLTHAPNSPVQHSPQAVPPRVVVREARYVERLAYTRSQAAQALGISRSTLRRLLPYLDTIEMPWGGKLIPVDELERIAVERRKSARPRLEPATRGRKPAVPSEIGRRIRDERAAGKSLRQIADNLNADRIPTAHGGACWWPSTVRQVLQRAGV
jgi:transcriptional regulator with XRE-family HTH domain